MERTEILKQLNEVFTDVLDNPDVVLQESTEASDVEGWDSLTHIQLVVATEKHFKVRFTAKEIQSWKNVGDLVNSVESKLKTV